MEPEKPAGGKNSEPSRPPKPAARAPNASSSASTAAVGLTSIELALVARFNLEMADAYDEVAEDPRLRSETRQTARASASERRERARLLESHAQLLGAYPTSVPAQVIHELASSYTGPERRKRDRRIRDRRAPGSRAPTALGHADRRTSPDRRQRERRGR